MSKFQKRTTENDYLKVPNKKKWVPLALTIWWWRQSIMVRRHGFVFCVHMQLISYSIKCSSFYNKAVHTSKQKISRWLEVFDSKETKERKRTLRKLAGIK